MQYVKKVCGKIVRLYRNFLMYGGEIKGSEKDRFSTRTLHQLHFPLVRRKCCYLLNGKIEKAYLARNFFCLSERRNSRLFFKLGAWPQPKLTHAYYAYYVLPLWILELLSVDIVTCQPIQYLAKWFNQIIR